MQGVSSKTGRWGGAFHERLEFPNSRQHHGRHPSCVVNGSFQSQAIDLPLYEPVADPFHRSTGRLAEKVLQVLLALPA
jgi:hypothetical protein